LRAAKQIPAGSGGACHCVRCEADPCGIAEVFWWQHFDPFFSVKILNHRKKSAHRGADPLRGAQARKRFQNLRKNFDTENETALPRSKGGAWKACRGRFFTNRLKQDKVDKVGK